MIDIDWYKIINDGGYSEKIAFKILTSLSYDKDNAPPLPQLSTTCNIPVLYGKRMMKRYFECGKNVEKPDIQSERLLRVLRNQRLLA